MKSFDPEWEAIHKRRGWGTIPNIHLIRAVQSLFVPDNQYWVRTALDVGCGRGAQTRWLAQFGFSVVGIDGSESAIMRCNDESDPAKTNPIFMLADVAQLPFVDSAFDLVTDVCCLQHIPAPHHVDAMKEIFRVLKQGGIFFSVTARWNATHKADTPMRRERKDAARNLVESAGFKMRALDYEEVTREWYQDLVSHWLITAQKPEAGQNAQENNQAKAQ